MQTAGNAPLGSVANVCTQCPAGGSSAAAAFSTTARSTCSGSTNGYTYSAGSVAPTGCAAGYHESADDTCAPCSAVPQSCVLKSPRVPLFGYYTSADMGFSVQITNWAADFAWAAMATSDSSTRHRVPVTVSSTGLVTVSNLAHATNASVTVTATKGGFSVGSATRSYRSLQGPGSYQSYNTYAPPAVAAALPAEVAASVLATYTATVEVSLSLAGLTLASFRKPAVQSAVRQGLARSYGVAKNRVTLGAGTAARRSLAARRLAGGVSFTVSIAVLPAQQEALQATVSATSVTILVNTLRAEMVAAGQASQMGAGFGVAPAGFALVIAPTAAPTNATAVKAAASQCSVAVAAVLVALAMHASSA